MVFPWKIVQFDHHKKTFSRPRKVTNFVLYSTIVTENLGCSNKWKSEDILASPLFNCHPPNAWSKSANALRNSRTCICRETIECYKRCRMRISGNISSKRPNLFAGKFILRGVPVAAKKVCQRHNHFRTSPISCLKWKLFLSSDVHAQLKHSWKECRQECNITLITNGWARLATRCGWASPLLPGLPKQHLITMRLCFNTSQNSCLDIDHRHSVDIHSVI